MPELPDVAYFERYLASTALHQLIREAEVRDEGIVEDISGEGLAAAARGRSMEQTRRHGKNLFVALGNGPWLVLHFGMTGFPRYFRRPESRPEHVRILFHLEDGWKLAYDCQRRLGHAGITQDPGGYIERKGLGSDALLADEDERYAALKRRRGRLKSVLMNQEALAGIGNLYADEILFQCGLHPLRRLDELSDRQVRRLSEVTGDVLACAVERNADRDLLPGHYLLTARRRSNCCPRCGTDLEDIKVGQRTTYFCPRCQGRMDAD
ncbi:MAG: DNA-formamidopyrimidine glycosylase family protein [Planctomycetota bacterium]